MFIMGLVLGAAAGILFTVLIANGIISDRGKQDIKAAGEQTECCGKQCGASCKRC